MKGGRPVRCSAVIAAAGRRPSGGHSQLCAGTPRKPLPTEGGPCASPSSHITVMLSARKYSTVSATVAKFCIQRVRERVEARARLATGRGFPLHTATLWQNAHPQIPSRTRITWRITATMVVAATSGFSFCSLAFSGTVDSKLVL